MLKMVRELKARAGIPAGSAVKGAEPIQVLHTHFDHDESDLTLVVYADSGYEYYGIGGGTQINYGWYVEWAGRELYYRTDAFYWTLGGESRFAITVSYIRYLAGGGEVYYAGPANTSLKHTYLTHQSKVPATSIVTNFDIRGTGLYTGLYESMGSYHLSYNTSTDLVTFYQYA